MEEYTPNSNKYKNSLANSKPNGKPELKPVAQGHVKDKTFIEKIFYSIVCDSVPDMKKYIIDDVIIPAITDGLYNIAISTVETIFGRSGSSSMRRAGTRSTVSYGDYYSKGNRLVNANRRDRSLSSNAGGFDFSNIDFDTRPKAEEVLIKMNDILDSGYTVSVKDFCTLSKVKCEYPGENYGWIDLSGTKVVRTMYGRYILTLPKPIVLPSNTY